MATRPAVVDVRSMALDEQAALVALAVHRHPPSMRYDAKDATFDANKERQRHSKGQQTRLRPGKKEQNAPPESRQDRRGPDAARTRTRSKKSVPRSRPAVADSSQQSKHPGRQRSRGPPRHADVNSIPLGDREAPFNVFPPTAKPPKAIVKQPQVCEHIGPSLFVVEIDFADFDFSGV